jgi:hypothetical protein
MATRVTSRAGTTTAAARAIAGTTTATRRERTGTTTTVARVTATQEH